MISSGTLKVFRFTAVFTVFTGFLCSAVLPAVRAEVSLPEESLALLQKANEHYRSSEYAQAASLYERLSRKHPDRGVFFYNLGNSLYRTGELGEAILAYERAKKRNPRNEDIQRNLEYVRGLLPYHIEDKRNWYLKTAEALLEQFREREIYFVVLLIYFMFASAWAYSLFFRAGASWGWFRKLLLILLFLSAALAAAKAVKTRIMEDAIVVAKEAEVRYGPSVEDQVALRLGEGLKVYVIDPRDYWSRIILVNGESGWIKNSEIRRVARLSGESGEDDDAGSKEE